MMRDLSVVFNFLPNELVKAGALRKVFGAAGFYTSFLPPDHDVKVVRRDLINVNGLQQLISAQLEE